MNQYWVRELPSGTCESGGGIPAPGQHGFTLVELMVVIVIIAILSTVAVPSFVDIIDATQRRSAVSSLTDAIATARAEAATRSVPVRLCATANPQAANPTCSGADTWETGILVRDGVGPIRVWPETPDDDITIRASGFSTINRSQVTFSMDGTLDSSGTLVVCDGKGTAEAVGIVVNVAGLARVAVDSSGNGVVEDHARVDVTCP